MNHEIYRRVMDRYRLQRDKNAAEEERRRAEIEREHPDLAALCRERHEMILGGIRKMLGGRGSAKSAGTPAIWEKTSKRCAPA